MKKSPKHKRRNNEIPHTSSPRSRKSRAPMRNRTEIHFHGYPDAGYFAVAAYVNCVQKRWKIPRGRGKLKMSD